MEQYFESFLKTAVAFFGILVYTRVLGKQQISQMTFYDYVTGITFGSIAASIAIDREANTGLWMWVLTVFVFFCFITGIVTVKSRPLRKLIEGEPTILIHNGKILEHNMAKLRYDMENLLMQLREKNVFNIADVEFAVAETDGTLSVLPKSQKRPVTPEDLNIPTKYEGVSTEIIVDGLVVYQNLQQNNLDEQWLINQLKARGYNSPKDIKYASLDVDGNLYIDEKRDELSHITDISD